MGFTGSRAAVLSNFIDFKIENLPAGRQVKNDGELVMNRKN